MFGKKSKLSETQKFIIAKGREVGNLKHAGAPFNNKNAMKAPMGEKVSSLKQGKPPFERASGPQRTLGKAGKFGA